MLHRYCSITLRNRRVEGNPALRSLFLFYMNIRWESISLCIVHYELCIKELDKLLFHTCPCCCIEWSVTHRKGGKTMNFLCNNNCSWIIILVILVLFCGGNDFGYSSNNGGCGCSNSCGCCWVNDSAWCVNKSGHRAVFPAVAVDIYIYICTYAVCWV